jgi:uncharacterized membrane protein HdeD (DUF308 family)
MSVSPVFALQLVTLALGATFVVFGAICTYVSLLCANGKIKPNGAVGVRLNFSRNSRLYNQEKYWYDINRYGGKKCLYVSVIWLLLGIIVLVIPVDSMMKINLIMAVTILVTAGFVINAWQIYRYAEKLVAKDR